MARIPDAPLLDLGDRFPTLELTLTDGSHLTVPADLSHPYNVVLVNRGAWCPYCVTQLRGFQAGLAKLAEAGIGVVSLSAESRDRTLGLVAEHRLAFPVAWGAPVQRTAEVLGLYYEPTSTDHEAFLHSAAFVLDSGGRVLLALYSSGAIGRLAWQDVLGYVQYLRTHS
ncbi:MAG TPA: redoxin domain-containing protein [Myxococcaceae bacterium]|nr:redoxin domain-containing protein [Myxococcaceae bacterium]